MRSFVRRAYHPAHNLDNEVLNFTSGLQEEDKIIPHVRIVPSGSLRSRRAQHSLDKEKDPAYATACHLQGR